MSTSNPTWSLRGIACSPRTSWVRHRARDSIVTSASAARFLPDDDLLEAGLNYSLDHGQLECQRSKPSPNSTLKFPTHPHDAAELPVISAISLVVSRCRVSAGIMKCGLIAPSTSLGIGQSPDGLGRCLPLKYFAALCRRSRIPPPGDRSFLIDDHHVRPALGQISPDRAVRTARILDCRGNRSAARRANPLHPPLMNRRGARAIRRHSHRLMPP